MVSLCCRSGSAQSGAACTHEAYPCISSGSVGAASAVSDVRALVQRERHLPAALVGRHPASRRRLGKQIASPPVRTVRPLEWLQCVFYSSRFTCPTIKPILKTSRFTCKLHPPDRFSFGACLPSMPGVPNTLKHQTPFHLSLPRQRFIVPSCIFDRIFQTVAGYHTPRAETTSSATRVKMPVLGASAYRSSNQRTAACHGDAVGGNVAGQLGVCARHPVHHTRRSPRRPPRAHRSISLGELTR